MYNMAQIPTAKQVYYKVTGCILEDHHFPNIEKAMLEYAKMHVEAALKEASEQFDHYSNKNVILNSYPLTNIK